MTDIVSERWAALERARLALAKFPRQDDDLTRALDRLAAIGCRMLGVARVSIWDIDYRGARLVLRGLADERDERIREIPIADLGAYARALDRQRVIAATDVASHELTAALLESYCRPLGIVSLLDVPIYVGGEVVGVVCHEHRGAPRTWTDVDADLGLHIAEVASSLKTEQAARAAEAEVRRSQARLAEVMRRAAVGRVARGIAHDLNNILGIVDTCARLIERRGDDVEIRKEAIATLEEVVASARRLIEELGHGRVPDAPAAATPLDAAMGEIERALAALAGADRRFTLTLGAPGVRVPISKTALEQVLVNLVVNAREATSGEEEISVRTSAGAPQGAADGARDGSTVATIEVRDGGHGMDERTIARLFEPQFSTKGPRRGIGLATVHQIVEDAGGWIDVESEPGGGATFRVRLPTER